MKKNIWNIIRILIILLNVILSGYLVKVINELNIIPNKYYSLGIIGLIILNLLSIILVLGKKLITKILGIFLSLIIIILSIIGIKYGDNAINLLNKAFGNNNLEITGYGVIVLKNSNYNEIKDLNNKTMGYLSINNETNDYLNKVEEKISSNLVLYEEVYKLYEDLLNKNIDSIVIDKAYLDLLEDEYSDIDDNIKIIYTFEIETKLDNNKGIKELKPVNIFISGSDARSDKIEAKTRSDVNMIMTINPNTHTILLTSIPRDYYVQLHGTTGLKDKLTHAGIYGIDMSRQTVEDLFDIEIDYSIKVGFKSVVEVVDLIGGIDVYSDTTFDSYHIKGWVVNEGMNHFDGKQSLAYSRERYAYANGDIHRVQNQQQVLEAIIDKIFKDRSILKKYDKLLDSFSELYRTDIPDEYIKLIVKDQLDSMESWTLEKQYVIGSNGSEQTYSMPGRNLYVMIPDEISLNTAKEKISQVYNGE